MNYAIHRRPKARQDLVDTYRYQAREAGFRVEEQFFAEREAAFKQLNYAACVALPATPVIHDKAAPATPPALATEFPKARDT